MSSLQHNSLLVDSVRLAFGTHLVLSGAYMTSETGKVTGLLGRNGSGKSCLFKCIMGSIKPQQGFVRVNDGNTDRNHIGRYVRYLPQTPLIPAGMTLEKAFNLYEVDYEGLVRNFTRFHRYHFKTPSELSGGEVRVAEMYLVLMSDVSFCILDEPFAQIAPIHAEKMKELIAEQKEKKGIIVSDHLYESIIEVADDLFVIDGGYTCPVHAREDLVRHGYLPR
ncbi:MAG: ATP-binding cassette domain-containing protein [Bacteroidales bacterium]|nr:ATP-binding cassette domain-containing protein [Bacteroidales bacterium]MBR5073521.1 ATP-binding cassette domain-containing protein [Bacteroidales bacterium]